MASPQNDYVRILPLGGLRTFGMNCCLIEHDDTMLMIDCGLAFPDDHHYGLDYYLPDWSYVIENAHKLRGVILTHSHEDHVGGLPFLLSELDIPVFTGRYTMALLNHRLKEWGLEPKQPMTVVEPGDVYEIGPYEVEFLHVNHSIANAMSIAVGTSLGNVLFTGDWKLDQTPIGEDVMDLSAFARIGDEGTLAVVGDSTNAEVPGFSTSERDVQKALRRQISEAPGRVFVGMFSSNIPRVRGLVETAQALGRKIVLLGRSLNQNVGYARENGFLPIEGKNPFIDAKDIGSHADSDLLFLATGSQAEPRSSLHRLAQGDHHQVTMQRGDRVILSARVIPGNEAAIYNMIDSLTRRGAEVVTPRDAPVHTTGHAYRDELKLLLNLVRPEWVVPVHGEYRMRLAHASIATDLDIESVLIEDGDVLEFRDSSASVVDRVPVGRIGVDGKLFGDLDDVQLSDRRKLAATGIVVAFAVLDIATGELTGGPDLVHRGFLAGEEEAQRLMPEAAAYARDAVKQLSPDARKDPAEVGEALRTAVRRYFRKTIDRKPVVVPVVHEL